MPSTEKNSKQEQRDIVCQKWSFQKVKFIFVHWSVSQRWHESCQILADCLVFCCFFNKKKIFSLNLFCVSIFKICILISLPDDFFFFPMRLIPEDHYGWSAARSTQYLLIWMCQYTDVFTLLLLYIYKSKKDEDI